MKKILLLSVVAMLGLSTFAQTSFADIAMSNTNKYAVPTAYTVANGGSVYVPVSSFTAGTGPYWDLSAYQGVEVSFTCAAGDVGKKFILRCAVVKADLSGVVDALKTITFTTENQVVTYNFTEEPFASNSKMVWGFKSPWSGNDAFTTPLTVNSINALSVLTSVPDMSIDNNKLVDVYDITGIMVRKGVVNSEATNGLPNGIYIVGNKKVYVRNK